MVQVKRVHTKYETVDHFSENRIVVDRQIIIQGRKKQGIENFPDPRRFVFSIVQVQFETFVKTGADAVFSIAVCDHGTNVETGTVEIDHVLLAGRQKGLAESK
jgi:hypothetical protein